MKQLIYRRVLSGPVEARDARDVECRVIQTPFGLLLVWKHAFLLWGLIGALRMAVRLISSRRMVYVLWADGCVANFGQLSVGFCRFYKVARDEVVIGPVATRDVCRGKGHAMMGMSLAMNEMYTRGFSKFVVDTAFDNIAMQRVIQKCGFGEPVGAFEREWL